MDYWYECLVCTETCSDAVESNCQCRLLLCASCANGLRSCPTCREEAVTFTPSHALRRVISDLPTTCSYCSLSMTFGTLKGHLKVCEAKPIHCLKCEFIGLKLDLLTHANEEHADDIVQFFTRSAENVSRNCIDVRTNQAGNTAKIGDSGKFYCGKRLNGPCGCCNGFCGPNNGCNCVDCMRLDIEVRNLPAQSLVNSEGKIAQRFGRGFVCEIRGCDGPGTRCRSCTRLEQQAPSRYSALL